MIGMNLFHKQSGISGKVDGVSVDAVGAGLVRIDDHWFLVDECIAQRRE